MPNRLSQSPPSTPHQAPYHGKSERTRQAPSKLWEANQVALSLSLYLSPFARFIPTASACMLVEYFGAAWPWKEVPAGTGAASAKAEAFLEMTQATCGSNCYSWHGICIAC